MTDRSLDVELRAALDWLEAHASEKTLGGMARYGIVAQHALGVSVGDVRALGKSIGKNHALARRLWRTGVYEARLLAAFVADPALLGEDEMDRWCRDFDNWAVCDTLCFHLFDKSPHAFGRIEAWATEQEEFVKRAAFALLASVALHDRRTGDEPFAACLPWIEAAADDERNFVKKGVSWALRGVGARSRALHAASISLAERLVASGPAARWVGKDALRDLTRPKVRAGLAAREARQSVANAPKRASARVKAGSSKEVAARKVSRKTASPSKVKKKAKKAAKTPARRRSPAG